mmetsp:Transcript_34719/g.53281  ORF Transcript_34719/g.53281 Transcript_34719/m.53281 type:complete len:215 (-) Transcript_34719:2728-3372(-)
MNFKMRCEIERFNDIIYESSKIKIPKSDSDSTQSFEKHQLERRVISEICHNLKDAEDSLDTALTEFLSHNPNMSRKKRQKFNVIQGRIMELLEMITNKSESTMIHVRIMRLVDRIMRFGWFTMEDKDTWTLINSASYFFDLHDVLEGSALSEKLAAHAKEIIMELLAESNGGRRKLDSSSSAELSKLLATDQLKSVEKTVVDFDLNGKEIKAFL